MSQYQPMYDSFQRDPRERYVPTSRINVSSSVYLPSSDMDLYTGQLKPDRVRRQRTQAKRLEAEALEKERKKTEESLQREMKKGGVRVTWPTAAVLCGVLVFMCLFSAVFQLSQISGLQAQINTLQRDIQACRTENEDLEVEIAAASDASVICYAASQNLNMIPAESAEAIHLVAVDTRPMQTAKQTVVQTLNASAQVQPTQVPAVASAGN